MSTKSKKTSQPAMNPETEWVAVDDGAARAELAADQPAVHVDEPDLDVVQHAPDEVVWAAVEPEAASDAALPPRGAKKAPRAAGAKPARVGAKARKAVTSDDAAEPAPSSDAPAPSSSERKPKRTTKRSAAQSDDPEGAGTQGDAGEGKGTLAVERAVGVATAATEPNAAAPVTTKRKLQKFVAERAEALAEERAAEVAAERAEECAAERASDVAADAEQLSADDLVAPEWDAAPTAAQPDARPSMEQFILELGSLSVAQLVRRHIEAIGKAPRIKSRPWLVKKLGWVEQTKRYGGLSIAAKKRLEQLMSEIELPIPTPRAAKPNAKPPKSADDMPIGTRVERKWHGKLIVATRVDGGWDCEGYVFKSLSAAAKAVSGSHVSGPAFFGLWKPKDGGQ